MNALCPQEPGKGMLGPMQELMDTRRQLRAQQAVNKRLQEQVACYEKDLEALRSNFSVSQSQASIAKVSTEINSKVRHFRTLIHCLKTCENFVACKPATGAQNLAARLRKRDT